MRLRGDPLYRRGRDQKQKKSGMTSSVAGRDLQRPLLGLSVVPFSWPIQSLFTRRRARVQFRQGGHPSSNSEQISHGIFYTAITVQRKIKIFRVRIQSIRLSTGSASGRRPVGSEYQNTISECRGSRTATRLLDFWPAWSIIRVHSQVYMEHHDSARGCPSGRRRDEEAGGPSYTRSRMCLRLPFGVSRSLGQGLRRRNGRRRSEIALERHEPEDLWCLRVGRTSVCAGKARKSGRGGSWDLPRPQLYAGDSDDEQKGRRPPC